jgi:hypothetical protein
MKTNKYSIVCICQIYNELEKGNLERFYKYIKPLVDGIVVYDDGSTDGSYEYSLSQTAHVIRGAKNNFKNEISHRQMMLEKALKLSPDFILWLDADEVLSVQSTEKLQEVCHECVSENYDGILIKELNIWRSQTWRRLDSLYDNGWFNRLWRVVPGLSFLTGTEGLHQDLFPSMVKKVIKTDEILVLHYGFSDKLNLSYKYLTSRGHGQSGYEMLDRLISEEKLETEKISKDFFPDGLWADGDEKPEKLTFAESLSYVDEFSERFFRPKYSIACLIYKSVDWLKFVYDQVLKNTDMSDKEFYFIANDADQSVLDYLKNNHIPHYIWKNSEKQKKEWYINNVYRAWNYAAEVARGDFIVFINSDMAFTPDWLDNLIGSYNGSNCVASRLIESGKLEVGKNGLEKNFGHKIAEFKEEDFHRYAQIVKEDELINGGLYMPLLIKKDHFVKIGGYPEGNVRKNSKDIFHPEIAGLGEPLISGDTILIEKLKTISIQHQTSFNSIVYHFQCGEMDEVGPQENKEKGVEIAICNDLVTGTMGEKVLWDYLLENIPGSYGVDFRIVGENNFSKKAKKYIIQKHADTKIIIQNASFIDSIDKDVHTIAFLQDDLRSMGRQSAQQELNLKLAHKIVTNSYQTAAVYRDYPCEIIPVGLDDNLFKPQDKSFLRKKHGFKEQKTGIFVGDFSEVKGWPIVKRCIEKYADIQWILVTKKNEGYSHPRAKVYKRIDQKLLAELLNCADFFIIGSPVETQCLAAIEACLCDVPVVMKNVGLFKDLKEEEKKKVGIIGDDLEYGVENIMKNKYSPRKVMVSKGLTIKGSMTKWQELIERSVLNVNINGSESLEKNKNFSGLWFEIEFFYRKKILKKIFGKEDLQLKKYLSRESILVFGGSILRRLGLLDFVKKIIGFKPEN